MIVLGIETSCDETSAAIVNDERDILSNRVLSQIKEHKEYGGVVPEIAARAHMDHLDRLVREAMAEAQVGFEDLSGVAVTGGPGLIGGVIVGVMTAKSIAAVHNLPFMAVNHLEGHALTARLTAPKDQPLSFPYLLLLVSGGHCQLLVVKGVGRYERLGTTIDDAVGEAFDKAAKLMGLGYPGGPAVEQMAHRAQDPSRFDLPRPLIGRDSCDFSFSGLKTAIRQTVDKFPPGALDVEDAADLCQSFQMAVGDVLVDRCRRAIQIFKDQYPEARDLVIAGGVAANRYLRGRLEGVLDDNNMRLQAPPLALCTDNGAMIAWAGLERLRLGMTDTLDFAPRPRWPLDPNAKKAIGAGVKA